MRVTRTYHQNNCSPKQLITITTSHPTMLESTTTQGQTPLCISNSHLLNAKRNLEANTIIAITLISPQNCRQISKSMPLKTKSVRNKFFEKKYPSAPDPSPLPSSNDSELDSSRPISLHTLPASSYVTRPPSSNAIIAPTLSSLHPRESCLSCPITPS